MRNSVLQCVFQQESSRLYKKASRTTWLSYEHPYTVLIRFLYVCDLAVVLFYQLLYMEPSARMIVVKMYLKTVPKAWHTWGEHTVSGFCHLFWILLTCLHRSAFRVRTLVRKAIKGGQKCLQRQQKMKNLAHLCEGENKANFMTQLISFLWRVGHVNFSSQDSPME